MANPWRSFRAAPLWVQVGVVVTAAVVVTAIAAGTSRAPKGSVAQSPTPGFSIESVPSTGSPTPSGMPTSLPGVPARRTVCRTGDPLANVYHPSRLHVVSRCRTVTGVVTSVKHEPDGDYHLNVRLDARYAGMVNAANKSREGGNLVVEIVPSDEPGCRPGKPPVMPYGTYDYGLCTGADIAAPPRGARVSITGPYVLDANHGWMEIHPVWRLSVLSSSATTASSGKPATSLRITGISPDPVKPGQYITLTAQTSAGASCSITVTYASGTVSSAQGLEAKNASSSGHVSWTWKVGTRTGAGTATARVACGSRSATRTFRVT